MDHDCDKSDDITEIKADMKGLSKSFNKFVLKISVDVAKLQLESSRDAKSKGIFYGAISSIVVSLTILGITHLITNPS